MIFNYSTVNSIACKKNNKKCFNLNIKSYFTKGKGKIFYKNYLNLKIIKKIKFFIFYLKILKKNKNLNYYIVIRPFDFKKLDNCLDLALLFSILLSVFNFNLNKNIIVFGEIDINSGILMNISNLKNKLKFLKNNFKLILTSKNVIWPLYNLNISILKFQHIYEIFFFIKRCLTQRKSNVFTDRMSRVQFSQHLIYGFKCL